VLLISLDTLRADHTGFGGYSKDTTPFLDSLAERGVVFDNHFSNSLCTLPSHATMLTGLHFPSHGVKPTGEGEPITVLPHRAKTLAEKFQEAGYFTAGFTTHGAWLNELYGFDRGFDHFYSSWDGADSIIERYLDLLDEAPQGNSFTFLHFFDIHSDNAQEGPCLPYRSSGKLVKEFAGERPPDFTGCSSRPGREGVCASNYLKDLSNKVEPLPEDHLVFLKGLYDAGIRWLDGRLQGLFEELEQRGMLEGTLIVITSDHGESFFEHEKMLHDTHHDEVARVPFLVVLPESSGVAPHRVEALTQSTQLSATILDLMGLDPIGQVDSLAPAIMLGEEPEDGLVLFQGHILIGTDEQGEFKFVKTGRNRVPVFYDRTQDPGELTDLLGGDEGSVYKQENRERLTAIYARFNELIDECKDLNKLVRSGDGGGGDLTPEQYAELRALGYLGDEEEEGAQEP